MKRQRNPGPRADPLKSFIQQKALDPSAFFV
jgi:hypothetical protein